MLITVFPISCWSMFNYIFSSIILLSSVVSVPFCEDHKYLRLKTPSRRLASVLTIAWCILDGIFSLICSGIAMAFVLIVFSDPDGTTNVAWQDENTALLCCTALFGLSFLCRLIFLIMESIYVTKTNPCCACSCTQYSLPSLLSSEEAINSAHSFFYITN